MCHVHMTVLILGPKMLCIPCYAIYTLILFLAIFIFTYYTCCVMPKYYLLFAMLSNINIPCVFIFLLIQIITTSIKDLEENVAKKEKD